MSGCGVGAWVEGVGRDCGEKGEGVRVEYGRGHQKVGRNEEDLKCNQRR